MGVWQAAAGGEDTAGAIGAIAFHWDNRAFDKYSEIGQELQYQRANSSE
jgi:hypothetical protein